MARWCAVALAAAGCAVVAGTTLVTLRKLPVETHSFNDLDAWPQLLAKGVRWIKIDLGYCTRASCTQFSTWPARGAPSDCFQHADGNEYCCMCMRGDASSRPSLTSPFNVTEDFLAFFASGAWRRAAPGLALSAGAAPASALSADAPFPGPAFPPPDIHRLMIGADFGGASVDINNVTESAMARNFLLAAHAVFTASGVNAALYHDSGYGSWMQTIDSQCASADGCSPADQALAALPFRSEGGDSLPGPASDPYGRFAVLNSDQVRALPPTVTAVHPARQGVTHTPPPPPPPARWGSAGFRRRLQGRLVERVAAAGGREWVGGWVGVGGGNGLVVVVV
jgi:hypothetical protein